MRFARHVVKMASKLAATGKGCCPPLPPGGVPTAVETFRSMEYNQHEGLFDVADFAELYLYLRGRVGLEIPDQAWRNLLPRHVPGRA